MLAILFELFIAMSMRSRQPIWRIGFFSNRWMLGAVAIPTVLQILLLSTPLRAVFQLVPLSAMEWGIVLLLSSSGFLAFEFLKIATGTRSPCPGDVKRA
jgi:Ca2+-transporting ATPase